jgi:hypothetical protein
VQSPDIAGGRGQHNDSRARELLPDRLDRFNAVDLWHPDIHQGYVTPVHAKLR